MLKRPLVLVAVGLAALAGGVWSCAGPGERGAQAVATKAGALAMPTVADQLPRDYPGVHNAVAFHEGFVSGSVPEGEAGFDTLAAMGVKTIISVDGAEPEVGKAAARGMKYIHLPIGYNGFDESRRLELARAVSVSMAEGPVYIHCHHGKHRSAGAAAAVAASLGWQTPAAGVERMRVAGTAANYTGLYACAMNAGVIEPARLEELPRAFPSVARATGMVKSMVQIDEAMDHLKLIEKAGWVTPGDHPDLVPVAEAGRMADLLRAQAEGEYTRRKPAEFAAMMRESQRRAQSLEDLLAEPVDRSSAGGRARAEKLSAQFKLVAASCKDCHAKHRD
jgi:protein tyrosine phosphatase (PTP) superfamily phosphohydrolase (DUF442 family)